MKIANLQCYSGESSLCARWLNAKSRERKNLRFLLSIDVNLHRRELSSSQLAVVALRIEKRFAVEAKQRQSELNRPELTQKVSEAEKGEAAVKAAAAVNTNKQYVKAAKKLEKDAPDLLEKVRSGEINLPLFSRYTLPFF